MLKDGGGRGCAGRPLTSWKVSVCNIQASVQVVFGKMRGRGFTGWNELILNLLLGSILTLVRNSSILKRFNTWFAII